MKKITAFFLILVFAFTAFAETKVPFAGSGPDPDALEKIAAVACQEDGSFSATTYEANALVRLFSEKIMSYAGSGMVYVYLSLEGNGYTGICYPCLNVLYAGTGALNAEYVMFALDGIRYDVRVKSTVSQYGRYKVETMKTLLTGEGLEMVKKLNQAEKASITILGSDQYRQTLDTKASYASQKNELGGKSLSALKLPEGTDVYADYALSDLAIGGYESAAGFEPEITLFDLSEKSDIAAENVYGLIADGASTVSVRKMQELLVKKGFLAGAVSTTVSSGMINAVKNAQAFYGLPETGYADARLVNRLNGNAEASANEVKKKKEHESKFENDNIALCVDRWWVATRAETTVPGGGVSVSDKGNVFIVLDGYMKSKAVKNLSLAWEITAELVLDETWSFPANLYVEAQAGETLSATLGMLAEGRLVVVSEMPENAATDGEWVLKIHEGADTFEFALSRQ